VSFATGFVLTIVAGAAFYVAAGDERDLICRPGYASSQRLHGTAAYRRLRDAAFARARVPVEKQCDENSSNAPNCFILDHIIPLCAKGTWSLDNLQVQSYRDAKAKDRIEGMICRSYCEGKLTLEQTQGSFHRTSP